MALRKRIRVGLLVVGLAGLGGCSGQDPDQPPVGSISVGARGENLAPARLPARSNAAPARAR
jgi:hypothetical protein